MREIKPGIKWIWYCTDTKQDAELWFEELTGYKPDYDGTVLPDPEGTYSFRLHKAQIK